MLKAVALLLRKAVMTVRDTYPDYIDRLHQQITQIANKPLDVQMVELVKVVVALVAMAVKGKAVKMLVVITHRINVLVAVLNKRRMQMARFRSKVDNGWAFANVRMSKEQREDFLVWQEGILEDTVEVVTSVLLTGYKMSIKWDGENETWVVTLTGTEMTRTNDKTSMSARHQDLTTALLLSVYKHVVICGSSAWNTAADEENWG